jgi:hypothetical protein
MAAYGQVGIDLVVVNVRGHVNNLLVVLGGGSRRRKSVSGRSLHHGC